MRVKFNNLTPDKDLAQELTGAYMRVMTSGQYIGGQQVEIFEREWAGYCEAKHCISTSSGQAALEILLRVHDIGYGDEVIVPAWTAIPTWQAVKNVGAILRPVDIDHDTFLLDHEAVMNQASYFTKAIVPVHLYGYRASADYASYPVIEDAAQAHGLKGLGNAAWSFYPTKNLGAYGDSGAITTNDERLANLCRLYRESNRLDPLQAAFLSVKLKYLDNEIDKRIDNAVIYDDLLPYQVETSDYQGIYHQYVIRSQERDNLKVYLYEKGIETMIHYSAPHRLLPGNGYYPVAERLSQEVLSLPIMCSRDQVEYVCEMVNDFYNTD